ncbi:MAG: signal peptidase II, partial [candidate division Zixibacteria bacterium]|nr:signal peptidase II [candidate division Zixibacteria bacterium]
YNRGGALGTQFGSSGYYLASSILILLLVLYYLYISRHNKLISWPLAFITGGAIGNIIDRIRFGRVVDFLDVDFFDIDILGYQLSRWWTFNIADAAITCAIVFIIVSVLLFPSKHTPKPPETEQT